MARPLELAENLVDPNRYEGRVCQAANWLELDRSRADSHSNDQSTGTTGQPKVQDWDQSIQALFLLQLIKTADSGFGIK